MERGVTRIRIELKYLLAPEEVEGFLRRIPDVKQRAYAVTTTYLDRPDRTLSRAALANPHQCTKLRLREYLESASSLWMEVKSRRGAWTQKERMRVGRDEVGDLLSGSGPAPEDRPCPGCVENRVEILERFREVARGPLVVVGCIWARRRTFSADSLRISIDQGVTYFPPPDGLYDTRNTLPPESLGAPLHKEPAAILELKVDGKAPAWCRDVVAGLKTAEYSKFRTLIGCLEPTSRVA
jgi:hypothetical protein